MNNRQRVLDPIGWLVSAVETLGFSAIFKRFFGLYRGIVIDNEDPEQRGRVRIQVPSIGHQTEDDVPLGLYALPCSDGLSVGASGKVHGTFLTPEIGDQVWVMFEKGLPTNPVYMGGWIHEGPPTNEFKGNPKIRGLRTESGHVVKLNDDDASITIAKGDGSGESEATMVAMTANSEVIISTKDGNQVYLNNEAGEITVISKDGSLMSLSSDTAQLINSSGAIISASGEDVTISAPRNITLASGGKITLKGAVDIGAGPIYEPAVTGTTFSTTVFAPHVHTSTGPGNPTTPPVTPPAVPGNGLSLSVRISKK